MMATRDWINLLKLSHNPRKWALLLLPTVNRWGTWGPERLSHLPKATQWEMVNQDSNPGFKSQSSAHFLIIGGVLPLVYNLLYPPQLSNPLLVVRIRPPLKTCVSSFPEHVNMLVYTAKIADGLRSPISWLRGHLGGPHVIPSVRLGGKGKQTIGNQRDGSVRRIDCMLLVLKIEECG